MSLAKTKVSCPLRKQVLQKIHVTSGLMDPKINEISESVNYLIWIHLFSRFWFCRSLRSSLLCSSFALKDRWRGLFMGLHFDWSQTSNKTVRWEKQIWSIWKQKNLKFALILLFLRLNRRLMILLTNRSFDVAVSWQKWNEKPRFRNSFYIHLQNADIVVRQLRRLVDPICAAYKGTSSRDFALQGQGRIFSNLLLAKWIDWCFGYVYT